jgi:hypothetical protein
LPVLEVIDKGACSQAHPLPLHSAFRAREHARRVHRPDHPVPKPASVTTPLPVLGGEDGGTVSYVEVRATAQAYRTQAELIPRMGHNMMLDPERARVAERIEGRLANQGFQLVGPASRTGKGLGR